MHGGRKAAASHPPCTPATPEKGVPVRGAPRNFNRQNSHAAILAALPSRTTFLAVVMGIARGFIASGTTRKRSTCRNPFSRLAPLVWTWSASWKLRSKFRSGRGGTHRHQLLGGRRVHGDRRVKVRLGRAHRHRDRDELDHFGRLMRKEMRADDPLRHAVDDQLS